MQSIKLSVVILSYNSLPLLEKCIDSIYHHNDIDDLLEVILVDNASDNQEEISLFLEKCFPDIRVILSPVNRGYGSGNNMGIRIAQGHVIMLMNPDVVLHEPVFSYALRYFKENKSQVLFGIQQQDQHHRNVHSFLIRKLSIKNFIFNLLFQKLKIFNPSYSVISGACFFLDKATFLKLGGYDEQIFLYGEERSLHERMLNNFPSSRISMNLKKSYIHSISSRNFSIDTVRMGLQSYFHLQGSLGIPYHETYKQVLKYYRFLILFYSLKFKWTTVKHQKMIIALLKKNFSRSHSDSL